MTTNPPYLSLIAPAIYQAVRAADYPCPSGDGYPTHALNIYRHLSLFKNMRTHEEGVRHLACALALALDLVEGTDPGGFYATVQARFSDAVRLASLDGKGGIERLHTLLAGCTEAWHRVPHSQDGSTRLTGYVTELIACLCKTLCLHGADPDLALSDLNGGLFLDGRPA